jgi:membrane protein YdbS with pleckstrin-like domain
MRWVSYVVTLVFRASAYAVPVMMLLALVCCVPGVSAEVVLLEGKSAEVGPGEKVVYSFYVRNNDRITETVTISVDTDFEYGLSTNNFRLTYGEEREVTVTVVAPSDVEEYIEEVVVIVFLEVSNINTVSTDFVFLIEVIPPEEIPDEDQDGIPDWEDEDYVDEDDYYDDYDYDSFPFESEEQENQIKTLVTQLIVLGVIITTICFIIYVLVIRWKCLEDFDEVVWDVELRPQVNTIYQGGYAHPSAKTVWTIENMIGSIGGVLLCWACFVMFDFLFFWGFPPLVTISAVVALVFLLIWAPIKARFYYHNYRFILKKDKLVVHSGIVTRWKTVVPYVRITDVDTIAGFWDRMWGLKTIRINTAGSSTPEAYIKGIFNPEPIMEQLLKKARLARDGNIQ